MMEALQHKMLSCIAYHFMCSATDLKDNGGNLKDRTTKNTSMNMKFNGWLAICKMCLKGKITACIAMLSIGAQSMFRVIDAAMEQSTH